MQKFFKLPWTKEKVDQLIEWWPHFGTNVMANILQLKRTQVKAKSDKLKLKILPKEQRLCSCCKLNFQYSRAAGLKCKNCFSKRRREIRIEYDSNLDQETILVNWFKRIMRTIRYRSKQTDLSIDYLMSLWNNQNGKCFYSNLSMTPPKYGEGRNMFSPSIDKIDPNKDYIVGNVVWATWACNAGKNEWSIDEYFKICKSVSEHLGSRTGNNDPNNLDNLFALYLKGAIVEHELCENIAQKGPQGLTWIAERIDGLKSMMELTKKKMHDIELEKTEGKIRRSFQMSSQVVKPTV